VLVKPTNIRVYPTVNRHTYTEAFVHVFVQEVPRGIWHTSEESSLTLIYVGRCCQTNLYSKLKNYGDIDAKKYDLLEVPRTRLARFDVRTLWTSVLEPKVAPSQATCRLVHAMYSTLLETPMTFL
jgi:hypothetical protein